MPEIPQSTPEAHKPFTKEMLSKTFYSAREALNGNLVSILVFEVSSQKIGIQYNNGTTEHLTTNASSCDLISLEEAKKIAIFTLNKKLTPLGRNATIELKRLLDKREAIENFTEGQTTIAVPKKRKGIREAISALLF